MIARTSDSSWSARSARTYAGTNFFSSLFENVGSESDNTFEKKTEMEDLKEDFSREVFAAGYSACCGFFEVSAGRRISQKPADETD